VRGKDFEITETTLNDPTIELLVTLNPRPKCKKIQVHSKEQINTELQKWDIIPDLILPKMSIKELLAEDLKIKLMRTKVGFDAVLAALNLSLKDFTFITPRHIAFAGDLINLHGTVIAKLKGSLEVSHLPYYAQLKNGESKDDICTGEPLLLGLPVPKTYEDSYHKPLMQTFSQMKLNSVPEEASSHNIQVNPSQEHKPQVPIVASASEASSGCPPQQPQPQQLQQVVPPQPQQQPSQPPQQQYPQQAAYQQPQQNYHQQQEQVNYSQPQQAPQHQQYSGYPPQQQQYQQPQQPQQPQYRPIPQPIYNNQQPQQQAPQQQQQGYGYPPQQQQFGYPPQQPTGYNQQQQYNNYAPPQQSGYTNYAPPQQYQQQQGGYTGYPPPQQQQQGYPQPQQPQQGYQQYNNYQQGYQPQQPPQGYPPY